MCQLQDVFWSTVFKVKANFLVNSLLIQILLYLSLYTSSCTCQTGAPCYDMKWDQSGLNLASTDLMAVLVLVLVCGGLCSWGSWVWGEVFCVAAAGWVSGQARKYIPLRGKKPFTPYSGFTPGTLVFTHYTTARRQLNLDNIIWRVTKMGLNNLI